MDMDISWELESKRGKADPQSGFTSSSEGIYIAVHMIQTRYSGMQRYMKYVYKMCGTNIPDIIMPGFSIY